jgi:HEAT repeat protein
MDENEVREEKLPEDLKQEKLPIDARLLSDAVVELNTSRRSVGLYPPDHPILKDSINRAFDFLKRLFELRSSITLGIAKDALVIDEYTLDRKNPVFQEFALSLHGKGIAAVTFYSGLEVEELLSLHELITMREGLVGGAMLDLAEKKGLRHIKLSPIDLSIFGFVEGQIKPGTPESKIWEDYLHGLLEGRLADRDAEDLVSSIPPEQVAFIINNQMPEDAPGETYDRVISTYLRRRSHRGLKREIFDKFVSFIDNLKPELKAKFLDRALSQPSVGTADVEKIFSYLKEEDLRKFIDAFEKNSITIPESLKNLVDKFVETRAEGKFVFDMADKGGAFVDDIEIDEDIIKLLEEDHFKDFVSEKYQRELKTMLKGIETEESQLTELVKQENNERVVDRTFSDVILELLEIDSNTNENYLRFLTKVSELVNAFLETGRFQELCDIYITIYSHALSGRFKIEASSMVEFFFRSDEFIRRLVEAFKIWGRYDREGAIRLAGVLKFYLTIPLLDTFSEEDDPNIRKFLLYLLSNIGVDVSREAIKRLNDERWNVVRNMISLIRECGGKNYVKHIRPFAKDKNKKVCMEAVKTLLYFGDRDGISYLKVYLRSDDPDLREEAANLSGSYRIKDTVPYLIEILEKRDVFGSWTYHKIPAIRALAKIGDPRAIEPLKRLYRSKAIFFSSGRDELRLEIFKTLKGYPENAIKPLLDLGLKSKNKEIRSLSQRLLKEPQDLRDKDNE